MLYGLHNTRRTLWKLRIWAACGTNAIRLADEMVLAGHCIQRKWELAAMMAQVKRLQPAVVVEIGTYRGGSLRCWSSVCNMPDQRSWVPFPFGFHLPQLAVVFNVCPIPL